MQAKKPKDKIIATATRLFHQQGYNSTGINEVISGNPSSCVNDISPSWTITPGVAGVDWIRLASMFHRQSTMYWFVHGVDSIHQHRQ